MRRRLREEITLLWRTSGLRLVRPTPLDEVRTAMAFFDATLFTVIPRLYRALDAALDPPTGRASGPASDTGRTGTRAPRVGSFLRPGSWIGGDRDGNPGVTAEITLRTLRIHADHVLRGYEAVATRLMQTVAAATTSDRVARPLASRLARDAEDLPETDRQLRRRFPDEPYRQRFGFIAERLRRTRAALVGEPAPLTGRYGSAAELEAELAEVSDALVSDGLDRVAFGDVAELRWQVGTFGFSLASLEIRQHAAVHRAALAAIRAEAPGTTELSPGVTLDEVLATFRAIGEAQARFGVDACHRYIVSFTQRHLGRDRRARAGAPRRWLSTRRPATAPAPSRRSSTSSPCSSRARRSRTPAGSSVRCSTIRATGPGWRPVAIGRRSCSATPIRTRSRGWWRRPGCSTKPSRAWPRRRGRGAWS